MDKTGIEWTDATWNPVTGCTTVSPGCDNCYAERFAERWRGVPGHAYVNGFDLTLRPERLNQPLRWQRPRRIFVNSMSDLFHAGIPPGYVHQIVDVMEQARWHQFQTLTKRAGRMAAFLERRYADRTPPPNLWWGVSVENRAALQRITTLRRAPAAVRFLSIEPLLESLGPVDLTGIHWVIVGGESGPVWRPLQPEWVRELRDQCAEQGVAFFFKQWSALRPKALGRLLDGVQHDAMPVENPVEAVENRPRQP